MPVKHFFCFFSLTIIILVAGASPANASGDLGIRTGLGYDFVSQEYFYSSSRYDTALIPNPDETDNILLRKDYLDDVKGLIYLKYNPNGEGRYVVETGWEQSPETFRARGYGHAALGSTDNRWDADFNFDIRNQYRGTADPGEDLMVFGGKLKYRKSLSQTLLTHLKAYGEKVAFDSVGELVYNYSRFGAEIGLDFLSAGYNSLYLMAGVEKRKVPDSAILDYMAYKAQIGYAGVVGEVQILGDLSLESKGYNEPDNLDNYILTTLTADLRIPVGSDLCIRPDIDLEYFNFENDNYLNIDYILGRMGILLDRDLGRFIPALGPKIEILSMASDFENDEDYLEYYFQIGLDFYNSRRAFFMLENQLGQHRYGNDPIYYSDFNFNRSSLIGSVKLWQNLNLDFLLSAEWEWHEIDSDDSRLYLISTGLIYTF
nr:hypothetical protein [candidate division Zixibacteria bacterium]